MAMATALSPRSGRSCRGEPLPARRSRPQRRRNPRRHRRRLELDRRGRALEPYPDRDRNAHRRLASRQRKPERSRHLHGRLQLSGKRFRRHHPHREGAGHLGQPLCLKCPADARPAGSPHRSPRALHRLERRKGHLLRQRQSPRHRNAHQRLRHPKLHHHPARHRRHHRRLQRRHRPYSVHFRHSLHARLEVVTATQPATTLGAPHLASEMWVFHLTSNLAPHHDRVPHISLLRCGFPKQHVPCEKP